jgi:tetrahydrodipicolinate N-succinyltransferase
MKMIDTGAVVGVTVGAGVTVGLVPEIQPLNDSTTAIMQNNTDIFPICTT